MKQRFFALCLALLLLLSACGEAERAVESGTPKPAESGEEKPAQSPESTSEPSQGPMELRYNTWETDSHVTHILRRTLDPQGLDLSVYFEIPYFAAEFGDHGNTEALNRFFEDLSDDFFSPSNRNLLDIWARAQSTPGLSYQWNAQVVFRSHKLVSVTLRYYWMAGGVSSFGSESYTFRTDTGELLALIDLAEGTGEELKAAILETFRENAECFYDLDGVLAAAEEYELEDFEFCLTPEGGVQINLDRYELGRIGAESSASFVTGLKLKPEWK